MPTGESQYHALELVLERRFSRGLQARFGYTYSRLKNNGAESAQGDNGDQRRRSESGRPARMALSADDTPHVFLTGFTWELPGSGAGLGGDKGAARRLEHQRHPPLRERPAAEHHDEQRPRRPALQQPEAAQSRVRCATAWPPTATSIRTPTTTSTGPPGRIRVRSRSATRPKRDGDGARRSRSSART